MAHRIVTLPFLALRKGPKGRVLRTIEERPVRIPVVGVEALARAARSGGGGFLVEHRGAVVSYYERTRAGTSVDAVVDMLGRRTRAEMRYPRGRGEAGPGPDGHTDLDAVAKAFGGRHVIVEDCLAELVDPPRIDLYLAEDGSVFASDGRKPDGRRDGLVRRDWRGLPVSFPLAHRDRAVAAAQAAFAAASGGSSDTARLTVMFGIETLDEAAVGRWVPEDERTRFEAAAPGWVLEGAAPLAGWFTRRGSVLYHDLVDAHAGMRRRGGTRKALRAFVDLLADGGCLREEVGAPGSMRLAATAAAVRSKLAEDR